MEETKVNASPEPKAAQPTSSTPSGSGGSKVVLIIVIVVVILAVLSFVGWYLARRAIGKVTGITGNAVSYTSGTNTISAGESTVWPKEVPSNFPKFEYGTIKGSMRDGSTWVITVADVSSDQINSYKQTLKNNGWTIAAELDTGDLISFNAENSAKQQITCAYTKGDKSAIIGIVTEKTGEGTATPD